MDSTPPPAVVPALTPSDSAAAIKKSKKPSANKVTKAVEGLSVDSQVQHTNDDSVVSKRSAGRMGYNSDDYLRHFVRKVARRSPLINRGYFLRILAMTRLVEDTLKHFKTLQPTDAASNQRLQVISLGAGFDTLAARCYDAAEFSNVHWYEVDFPDVIRNKTQLMCAAPMTAFPFHSTAVVRGGREVVAERYAAVGLDLRNTATELIPLLATSTPSGGFSVDAPTIIYAECVMQYMNTKCSDEIVRWVAATFPNAIFYAYDQLHPYDSFGQTMTSSLKSKQSPLLGVHALHGGLALSQRAAREGMPFVRFSNFYRMSRFLFDEQELARHDAIESFDEMEEWCEMCEHYGILCGATNDQLGASLMETWDSVVTPFQDYLAMSGAAVDPLAVSLSSTSSNAALGPGPFVTAQWPTGRCSMEGWGFGGVETLDVSRSLSSASSSGDVVFITFGGLLSAKGQARSNLLLVHSLAHGDVAVKMVYNYALGRKVLGSNPTLPALVFHTFHAVGDNVFLVVGGRTNPTDVSDDVYELEVDVVEYPASVTCTWNEVARKNAAGDPLPTARYRHTAVALPIAPHYYSPRAFPRRVFMFGGRGSDGTTLGDAWILEYHRTSRYTAVVWKRVGVPNTALGGPLIPPLHSSAAVAVNSTSLLLSGGASSLHEATDKMWYVSLFALDSSAVLAEVELCQPRIGAKRFSHAMAIVALPNSKRVVLVQGGSTTEPKHDDDLTSAWVCPVPACMGNSTTSPQTGVPAPSQDIAIVSPTSSPQQPFESIGTWTRHSLVVVSPSVVAMIGGGLTCFSFGTYTCKPRLLCLADKKTCDSELQQFLLGASESHQSSSAPSNAVVPSTLRSVAEIQYSPLIFCATLHGGAAAAQPPQGAKVDVDDSSGKPKAKKIGRVSSESFKPKVFRGVPMGPCLEKWQQDPSSIVSPEAASDLPSIAVHVSKLPQPHFDFVRKNFTFRHVSLSEMLQHCFAAPHDGAAGDKEYWYFRSVGKNMKTDRSDFWTDFPLLAQDVVLPNGPEHRGWDIIQQQLHQSCLRINQANMQLWTHYDTMDNVLLQMVGVKRVILFPPEQHGNLYMKGSSSMVTNIDAPDLARFPRFADAMKHSTVVDLHPGDVLFIPANWFHHITATTSCIGLNLFYHRLGVPRDLFDAKDLYGNKDPLPCTTMRETLLADILKRFGELHYDAQVPVDYAQMAMRQLIQDLESAADDLASTITKKHN